MRKRIGSEIGDGRWKMGDGRLQDYETTRSHLLSSFFKLPSALLRPEIGDGRWKIGARRISISGIPLSE